MSDEMIPTEVKSPITLNTESPQPKVIAPALEQGKAGMIPGKPQAKAKHDLWAPLPGGNGKAKAAPGKGQEATVADEDDGELEPIADDDETDTDEEEVTEKKEVDEDEEHVNEDLEARGQKAITLKTKDGQKIVVPKDALFPFKKDGKVQWIPFNLAARQIDGVTNYSEKLKEVDSIRQRSEVEVSKTRKEIKSYEDDNQNRQKLRESLQHVFENGSGQDKLKALDSFLANQIGVSPEIFLYDLLTNLQPHLETWSAYSPDKREALVAQAKLNWIGYKDQRAKEAQAKSQESREIGMTQEQVQQAVTKMSSTYGFTGQEWEKAYDELAQAKEKGEIENFQLNDIFFHTMRQKIHSAVLSEAPKTINPIFRDPGKAKELSEALFELFKAHPTKPKEWFIERAKAAYSVEANKERVSDQQKRSNPEFVAKKKNSHSKPPPVQANWRW